VNDGVAWHEAYDDPTSALSAVIWTRNRRPPGLTPRIRAQCTAGGFEEVAFGSPEAAPQIGVRVTGLRGPAGAPPDAPVACWPSEPLFTFGPDS
jgi:hypothetical protein